MKKSNFIVLLPFALGAIANAQIATKENVTKLYIATFSRVPDVAGLNYWINDSKLNLEEISISFFDQAETKEKYPEATTNREFITAIYLHLFAREVDEDGLKYWIDELENNLDITRPIFILATINGALEDDYKRLNNLTNIGLSCTDKNINNIDFLKTILNKPYAITSGTCETKEATPIKDTPPTITTPKIYKKTETSIEVKGDIKDIDGVKYTKTYRAYIKNGNGNYEEIESNTSGKFDDLEAGTKYYFTIEAKTKNLETGIYETVKSSRSSYIMTEEVEEINTPTPYYPPYIAPVANEAPDAIIETYDGGDLEPISIGGSIKLDGANSTDSDGEVESYRWYNDADETLGTSSTYNYTGSTVGYDNINLEVTDNDGDKDTATTIIETYDEDEESNESPIAKDVTQDFGGSSTGEIDLSEDERITDPDGDDLEISILGSSVLDGDLEGLTVTKDGTTIKVSVTGGTGDAQVDYKIDDGKGGTDDASLHFNNLDGF